MGDFTPWALCIGVFLVWPALMFAIGFYVGRNGFPFSITIRRKVGRKAKSLSSDGYGLAVDDT